MENSTTAPAQNMEHNFHICDFYHVTDVLDIFGLITASLNWAFCLTAIFGNALVLLSIKRAPSMGRPSKILLCSLALSDFFVGFIVQPSFALHKLLQNELAACVVGFIYDFSSGHLSLVSLLTMVFISLDKFLALYLKLRYRRVVTFKRVFIVVTIIWTISFPWSAAFLLHSKVYFLLVMIIIPLSFLATLVVFIQIYTVLHRQQNWCMTYSRKDSMNIFSYRKSVTNMLYIYCALLFAYFPVWLALLIRIIYGHTTKILQNATELGLLIVLINSTVNPLLCFWRIREIRLVAKTLLEGMFRKRIAVEDVAATNNAYDSVDFQRRIRETGVGLENDGTAGILVKDLEDDPDVFTSQ